LTVNGAGDVEEAISAEGQSVGELELGFGKVTERLVDVGFVLWLIGRG